MGERVALAWLNAFFMLLTLLVLLPGLGVIMLGNLALRALRAFVRYIAWEKRPSNSTVLGRTAPVWGLPAPTRSSTYFTPVGRTQKTRTFYVKCSRQTSERYGVTVWLWAGVSWPRCWAAR